METRTLSVVNAKTEKLYPYVIGIVAGVAMACACSKAAACLSFPGDADILSSSISLAAIFAGFLATAKSMIISIQNPTMDKIRGTRFYKLLIQYLAEAIWVALVFCAFSLAGYFVPNRGHALFVGLWTFLACASLLTWFRVTRAFLDVMRPA